ncbi:MAG: DUF115 domain-containing protein [Moritella sp.]|uniref:motility associated factor glycosyltransferase family protein n=1 Tax=Moritella sp. TaxID=78556 RepID=UPI0029AF0357|nr:6-hydroxymethylpterin diphosphokinase MptE-like protein [Moritella sp.]MDX2319107.1 DUF115 domain-containing protein [Moritella sp.]
MDSLNLDISAQIATLEAQQQQRKKQVSLAHAIDAINARTQPIADPMALYSANMQAFKQYIPDVHQSFVNYQPSKFELAHVGDALHLVDVDNNLVLGENYFHDSLIDFEQYRINPQLARIDFEEEINSVGDFIHVKYLNQFIRALKGINQKHKAEFVLPEAVNMMVFFGLGLGYFLPEMLDKHSVKRLYIYEPENDFFYASLFTLDWASILQRLDESGSSLHLCLGADEELFFNDISHELMVKGRYDSTFSFCYQHYETEQTNSALEKFNQQNFHIAFGLGFFDDSLLALAHQYHTLNQHIPLLADVEPLPECETRSVFILGNGPSLDEHIEFIRAHRDKVLLVSGGTTIRALQQYGITPDFHLEMERTKVTYTVLKSVDDDEYLKSIPLLTLNTITPDVTNLFDRKLMGMKLQEPSTEIITNPKLGCDSDNLTTLIFANPTVSNLALSYFTRMGFKNIYLFGVDLGFAGKAHHSKKSIYYNQSGEDKLLFNKKELSSFVSSGNHAEEVETTMIFQMSGKGMGELLAYYPEVKCYNLGSGIKIENTIPTYQEDVVLTDEVFDKAEFVDRMLAHYSADTQVLAKQYSAILEQDIFADFVDKMIALIKSPIVTRYDALEQLHQQLKLLNSQYNTKHAFLVELLNGTLQHCHAALIKMLLLPASPEQGLIYYQQGLDIFINYLEAAKVKYQRELFEVDQTDVSGFWK